MIRSITDRLSAQAFLVCQLLGPGTAWADATYGAYMMLSLCAWCWSGVPHLLHPEAVLNISLVQGVVEQPTVCTILWLDMPAPMVTRCQASNFTIMSDAVLARWHPVSPSPLVTAAAARH